MVKEARLPLGERAGNTLLGEVSYILLCIYKGSFTKQKMHDPMMQLIK